MDASPLYAMNSLRADTIVKFPRTPVNDCEAGLFGLAAVFRVMLLPQIRLLFQAFAGDIDADEHELERFLAATCRCLFLILPRCQYALPPRALSKR